MAVAFFAIRRTAEGHGPVVLKVTRPLLARHSAETVSLALQKEAVALGRLNEMVPPTPFVVRLVDMGNLALEQAGHAFELPWIAVEYVHGGIEGTTLYDRVQYSVHNTRAAFDPARVVRLVQCLAAGLDAVHAVGVTHRDLTPANVLSCGFGADEMFKITDFGISRPAGIAGTFGAVAPGTPGYAPPEQVVPGDTAVGPASDVFSFAALTFFALTGEHYFPANSPVEGVILAQQPTRRRLSDCAGLSEELGRAPAVCAEIDAALTRATSEIAARRPQSAGEFGASVLTVLSREPASLRPSSRRLLNVTTGTGATLLSGWAWTVRQKPTSDVFVRRVAWEGDGSCLAATNRGLAFWNGSIWNPMDAGGLAAGTRFVHRAGPGDWLVGGDGAAFVRLSARGVSHAMHGPDPSLTFTMASGTLDDLLVLVGELPGQPPLLYTLVGRRWLAPAALPKAATVLGLARLSDEEWLLVGRSTSGEGFAAIFSPLALRIRRIATPAVRAYVACAGNADTGVGLVVGARGRTVRLTHEEPSVALVDGEADLTAAALDASGTAWCAGGASIYVQMPIPPYPWRDVFRKSGWEAPIVSLHADIGVVFAVTADGAIVEGRQG